MCVATTKAYDNDKQNGVRLDALEATSALSGEPPKLVDQFT